MGERTDGLAGIERQWLRKATLLVKRELCMLDKMTERRDWIAMNTKHWETSEQAEKKVE